MAPLQISLTLPVDLGSSVIAKDPVQSAVSRRIVGIASSAPREEASGTLRDFGATTIVILGTAAAAAAVKGLFDVLKTAVQEAYKAHRQKKAHAHDVHMLVLKAGQKQLEIDLLKDMQQIALEIAAFENEINLIDP